MSAIQPKITKTEEKAIIAKAEAAVADISAVKSAVAEVIFGQNEVVERTLITLLSGGHGLLVGLPGLAKTKLVETLGTVLGINEQRIQFTPDLMPSDILGSEILHQDEDGKRSFQFIKGPVFTQLLMADEINRASPRTQAALLQSMQEHHVTIAGKRYDLPKPFHVLATQNPLEQEGTYPLPEAQLDRFLMQIDIHYPGIEAERQIMLETTGVSEKVASEVMKNPFDFGKYRFEFADSAKRYDNGSHNLPGIFALGGALSLIEEVGLEQISKRILMLTDRLVEGVRGKGYRMVSSRSPSEASGIVAFRSDDEDLEAIRKHLEEEHHIIIAVRCGRLRASPHFYNTEAEIDQLIEALPGK